MRKHDEFNLFQIYVPSFQIGPVELPLFQVILRMHSERSCIIAKKLVIDIFLSHVHLDKLHNRLSLLTV